MQLRPPKKLSPDETARLRAVIETLGIPDAALALAVARPTILRVVRGLPLRRGTVALLRQQLPFAEADATQGAGAGAQTSPDVRIPEG